MERNAPGRPTPELMQLRGARLASINETQENQKISERQVKYIVSNEPITARNLHEGLVTFWPTHKPWLRTNHLPVITGTDLGIWRRIGAIRFPIDLGKKLGKENLDPYFYEKCLLPELPGILNWALEGLRMYLREKLKPPASVQRDATAYRHSMDFAARWLTDCGTPGPGWTYTSDAYDSFALWYRAEIADKYLISKNRFGRIMREKFGGDDNDKEHGQRVYRGFALTTEANAALSRHREEEQRRRTYGAQTESTPVLRGERPPKQQGGNPASSVATAYVPSKADWCCRAGLTCKRPDLCGTINHCRLDPERKQQAPGSPRPH